MKKILMFLNSFDVGGVTNVVKEIYRNIDRTKFSMDFVRENKNVNDFDKEILSNGDNIYYYTNCPLNKIPFFNYYKQRKTIAKQILSQIKSERYDVIHIHANAIIGLHVGMKAHIPIRIMHFHEAVPDFGDNINKSKITNSIWKSRQKKYNKWATVNAGDSLNACKIKYGDNVINDPKLCVLYPPIDMEKFNPDKYSRVSAIEEFSIDENSINIIHVGRLNPVKNQKFIIDILKEIIKIKDANLYFVGDGELKMSLIDYAEKLGVLSKVHFLPPNTSPAIYKAMDCSVLPSFSEAFGMVAVESQLMGVPCLASTNVPNDVDIGGCKFLDLSVGLKVWAEQVLMSVKEHFICTSKKSEFEFKTLISKLEYIYSKN